MVDAPDPHATRYKVLALKYRPQTFDDIVGQSHVKLALRNAIELNKVHHAFMFAGSRGTGKTTSARILAKALNCLSFEHPTPTPCGTCVACREIAESRDLDVLEIDGASNNGVEQIRDLRSSIENRPVRDRFRVIIIDEVHMLSTAAFNALLKTLEEPPAHVKFIFATTDPHKVPETIHSRCQHYDFRRLSINEIVESLANICSREGVEVGEGVLSTIASIAEGGMRDAQSKLDQAIAFRGTSLKLADLEQVFGLVGRHRLLNLLTAMREAKTRDALGVVDEVFTQGKDLTNFVADLLRLVRDLMLVKTCGTDLPALDLLPDEVAKIETEASHWHGDAILYALDALSDVGRRLKTSDFPRMLLEALIVKLCDLGSMRPVRDIMGALDAMLKGRVAPAASPVKKAPALNP